MPREEELLLPLSRLVKDGSCTLNGDRLATDKEVTLDEIDVSLSEEPGRWPLVFLDLSGDAEELADRRIGRRVGGASISPVVKLLPCGK